MTSFRIGISDGVATVTLNRPDRLNALLNETYDGLRRWTARLPRARDVRAVVLTGAGSGFCSGGDLEDVVARLARWPKAKVARWNRSACALVANLRKAPQPVVAAVNGVAAGGGAALALAADIRLASPAARFLFPFPRLGLSGADMGITWLLPRIVGHGRAAHWLLAGESVPAREALEAGLVTRLVPARRLAREAGELARKLARGPAGATAATKHMLDREAAMSLPAALRLEADVESRLMTRPEFRRAVRALAPRRS